MFPMPRTSRRMSDGRMCRAGSPRSAGADPIAISRSPTRPRPGRARAASSQVAPLLLLRLLMALARLAHARHLGRCRDWHFPPALVARDGDVTIDGDMDHDRAVDLLRGGKRIAQLGDPVRTNDV